MNKTHIGIFGGTFDPIHNGHLGLARELLEFPLDQILFVPCKQPVHRDTPLASAEQRLELLKLGLKDEPRFAIDECELRRPGPSYTIDTLRELKQKFPNTVFHFILGMDAFAHFTQWHEWEAILRETCLIVVHRPGVTLDQNSPEAALLKKHASIAVHESANYPISATNIRKQLHAQNSNAIKQDLPATVYQHIMNNKLYL